jgi:hypothetical protein
MDKANAGSKEMNTYTQFYGVQPDYVNPIAKKQLMDYSYN